MGNSATGAGAKDTKPSPIFRAPPTKIIVDDAIPFVAALGLLTLVCTVLGFRWIALGIGFATLFLVNFFRNPRRKVPQEESIIVAPADGTVMAVDDCVEERYLKARAKRISIFMSPLDCHINFAPVTGTVVKQEYRLGSFLAAFRKKSFENEHHAVFIRDLQGSLWLVVQIAGWFARRIVKFCQVGEPLLKGASLGMVRFGSRVDLYGPLEMEILVRPKQHVKGASTPIGRLPGKRL